jgi:tetratricopeptide (TPR) repeat protein
MGLVLDNQGRFDEAFAHIGSAHELDPLSLPINTNLGWLLYLARRYDDAIEQYVKTIDLDPGFPLVHRRLAQTYEQTHRYMTDAGFKISLPGEDIELLSARAFLRGGGRKKQSARD